MRSTAIEADFLKLGLLTSDGRRTAKGKQTQADFLKLGLLTSDGRRT